jgi:hypothetical protein
VIHTHTHTHTQNELKQQCAELQQQVSELTARLTVTDLSSAGVDSSASDVNISASDATPSRTSNAASLTDEVRQLQLELSAEQEKSRKLEERLREVERDALNARESTSKPKRSAAVTPAKKRTSAAASPAASAIDDNEAPEHWQQPHRNWQREHGLLTQALLQKQLDEEQGKTAQQKDLEADLRNPHVPEHEKEHKLQKLYTNILESAVGRIGDVIINHVTDKHAAHFHGGGMSQQMLQETVSRVANPALAMITAETVATIKDLTKNLLPSKMIMLPAEIEDNWLDRLRDAFFKHLNIYFLCEFDPADHTVHIHSNGVCVCVCVCTCVCVCV